MTQLSSNQIKAVIAVLFFKIIIIIFLPLTGDEAYFIKWATHLNIGYYDHPPMIGWVLYLMSFISESHIFYRFFSFFTVLVVANVMYKIAILYGMDKNKALLIYMVFLVSPIDVLLSLITNDISLLLFGSLGTFYLLYALEKTNWLRYSLLAGLFLGFAFLSKYFAVFLLFSLFLFAVFTYKIKSIKVILVVSILVLLAVAQNLYFNYNSCWNNILFNFFARTQDSSYQLSTVIGYFATILYILTPWGLYFLIQSKNNFKASKFTSFLVFILGVMFIIFLTVSLKNKVGLHWFLLFLPYMYLLFSFLDYSKLEKLFKYNAIFSAIHIVILLVAIFIPKDLFSEHKRYSDVILYDNPKSICNEIEQYKEGEFFTYSYSSASFLSYYCQRDISMLFNSSKYGRFDDKLVDIRELDTKDIVIMDKRKVESAYYNDVCESMDVKMKLIDGAKFYFAECKNFSFDKYKKHYLEKQRKKYYNIPDWLPQGTCYFEDRYFK